MFILGILLEVCFYVLEVDRLVSHLETGGGKKRKRPPVNEEDEDDDNDGDVEEAYETARAVALFKKRKRRNAEKNVLSRQLLTCPALMDFMTGASDGDVNKFHCSFCNKDISILSKGFREPMRHFLCISHQKRDQRYHLEEHQFIYELNGTDTIPSSELTEEERRIILARKPVVLSGPYPFPEDNHQDLSHITSEVPLSTLLTCVMELLRHGGNYSLLRKQWCQFRSSLGTQSGLSGSSWSKSETLVSILFFLSYFSLLFVIESFFLL